MYVLASNGYVLVEDTVVRSRIILSYCMVAAAALLWADFCAAETPAQSSSQPARGADTAASQPSAPPLILRDSGDSEAAPASDTGPGPLWRMLGYSLVIVVLATVMIVVFKKILPRLGVPVPGGKRVVVLEATCIGPRKTVHLLKVGNRDILVASTREHVCMLTDVTGAFDDPETPQDEAGD